MYVPIRIKSISLLYTILKLSALPHHVDMDWTLIISLIFPHIWAKLWKKCPISRYWGILQKFLDPDPVVDDFQSVLPCPQVHTSVVKIVMKIISVVLFPVANKRTDKRTNKQTNAGHYITSRNFYSVTMMLLVG